MSKAKQTKPDPIPPDQARALSDYRCACRKMAALLLSRGRLAESMKIETQMEQWTVIVHDLKRRDTDGKNS